MRKLIFLVVLALAGAAPGFAQATYFEGVALGSTGKPVAGAHVAVCTQTAVVGTKTTPCSPLATIYTNVTAGTPTANPLTADGLGNFHFWAQPGQYTIQIYKTNIDTQFSPLTITCSPTGTNCGNGSGSSFYQVVQANSTPATPQTALNLINGTNTTVGCVNNAGNASTDCRINVPAANNILPLNNIFTGSTNNFIGPVPYRSVPALFPAGGCSETVFTDPTTTGSINASSPTLTLTAAKDYKTGCGIAVVGAGATASLAAPSAGCTISTIARAANVVTVTCTAPHGMELNPAGPTFTGVTITGVTNTTFNGNFLLLTIPSTTTFTYAQVLANASDTTGTAQTIWGYAHGTTGSTPYNYKFSACEAGGGCSAASSAFTISNGNATLSRDNYNWIGLPDELNVFFYAVYSDRGLGGAYSCVGTAFNNAYSDFGFLLPCPPTVPATPPVSATANMLNTIIDAGGGTTTLTLHTAASNTATAQNVYHDISSFINTCIDAEIADMITYPVIGAGTYGCRIPGDLGTLSVNGPLHTISANAFQRQMRIEIGATLTFNTIPWWIRTQNTAWDIEGVGNGAIPLAFGPGYFTPIQFGPHVPAAFVLQGNITGTVIAHLAATGLYGHGIFATKVTGTSAGPSDLTFTDLVMAEDQTNGYGAPFWFDDDTLGVTGTNLSTTANTAGTGLRNYEFTSSRMGGNGTCCFNFTNSSMVFSGIRLSSPAGNLAGTGHHGITFNQGVGESFKVPAFAEKDNGAVFVGAAPFTSDTLNLLNYLVTDWTAGPVVHTPIAGTSGVILLTVQNSNQFSGMVACGTVATCGPVTLGQYINSGTVPGNTSVGFQGTAISGGAVELNSLPLHFKTNSAYYSSTPYAFDMALAAPDTLAVSATGVGTIGAGTYYYVLECGDVNGNYTLPSNEVSVTVGALSSVTLSFNMFGIAFSEPCTTLRLFRGTSSGGETDYITKAGAYNVSSFLDDGSGISMGGALQTLDNQALYSAFNWKYGASPYFFAGMDPFGEHPLGWEKKGSFGHYLGIDSKWGVNTDAFFRCAETTTPGETLAGYDYIWCDSSHRLKFVNNNGTPDTVAGLLDIPSANSWALLGAATNSNAGTFALSGNTWDAHAALHTLPSVRGLIAALPVTCTVGEEYFATDATAGQNKYFCTAANTWTQQLNSGAAGASTALNNLAAVAINTDLLPASAGSASLGSNTLPFGNVFFGTVANQSGSFNTANLTANHVINVPNATSTPIRDTPPVTNQFMTGCAIATGICSQATVGVSAYSPNSYIAGAGAVNVMTATMSPAATSYATGLTVNVLPNLANTTTTPTLNVNGLGAKTVVKFGNAALAAGDYSTTAIATFVYDGTNFQLQNPQTLSTAATSTSTTTFTNKTLNAESTGNSLSFPIKATFGAAGCNNSTAGPSMDLGTTNAPTPQCAGTTVRKGVLAFSRGNVAYINWHLPKDWNSSAATDLEIGFTTTDTTNGHVTSWNIQTACNKVDGTATDDPTLNTLQALSVTTGASQVSGGQLVGTKTGLTMTGCVADYNFEIAITRNNSGTDTNTDTAVGLKFAEVTIGVTKDATNR